MSDDRTRPVREKGFDGEGRDIWGEGRVNANNGEWRMDSIARLGWETMRLGGAAELANTTTTTEWREVTLSLEQLR